MPQHPSLFVLRILWLALFVACLIYVGISLAGIFPKPHEPPAPLMPMLFGVVGTAIAVLSFVMPRQAYGPIARKLTVKIKEEAAPEAFAGRYRDAMQKQLVFADPKKAASAAFTAFMTPFILSLALSEAIAVFGLTLVAVGFELLVAAPFFGAGAILILIRFPTQKKVLGAFEQAHGASFPTAGA